MRRERRHHQHPGHGAPAHHEQHVAAKPEPSPRAEPAIDRVLEWVRSKTRHQFRPDPPVVPPTLKVTLGILLLIAVGLAVSGQAAASRRTASADATIVAVDLPADPNPAVAAGKSVAYRVIAGGGEFAGRALVDWSLESIHAAHVCYEPANPDNNLLVRAGVSCS